jgi:hypothetical protein
MDKHEHLNNLKKYYKYNKLLQSQPNKLIYKTKASYYYQQICLLGGGKEDELITILNYLNLKHIKIEELKPKSDEGPKLMYYDDISSSNKYWNFLELPEYLGQYNSDNLKDVIIANNNTEFYYENDFIMKIYKSPHNNKQILFNSNSIFFKEIALHYLAYVNLKDDIVPIIGWLSLYDATTNKYYIGYKMKKMENYVIEKNDILQKGIEFLKYIVIELSKIGIIHNNLHFRNLLYENNKFFITDFSMAKYKCEYTDFEREIIEEKKLNKIINAKPIKLDLQLTNHNMNGGNGVHPNRILRTMNNLTYKYVIGKDANQNEYVFYFNDDNTKTFKNNSKYLGAGDNTAVFVIECKKPDDFQKNIVLRVSGREYDNKKFIIKYNNDVSVVDQALPKILFYGELKDHLGNSFEPSYKHTIMLKYMTNFDILSAHNKLLILKSLLHTLIKLDEAGYFLFDLKLDNIGYDNEYNCILIDYDMDTLVKYKKGAHEYIPDDLKYVGTYIPLYVMKSMQDLERDGHNKLIGSKYDKFSVAGIATIIVDLFFKPIQYINAILKKNDPNVNLRVLYIGGEFYDADNNRLNYEEADFSNNKRWSIHGTQNISNINIMTDFIEKLICIDDINMDSCMLLKKILLDNVTDSGLMHPIYENIPAYNQILQSLEDFKIQ